MSLPLRAPQSLLQIYRLHTIIYFQMGVLYLLVLVSCTVQHKIALHVVVQFSCSLVVHVDHVEGCGCVEHRGNTEAVGE